MPSTGRPCSICGRGGDSVLKHKPEGCLTGLSLVQQPDGSWRTEFGTTFKGKQTP